MNRLFYGSSNVYRHFPRSSIGTELNISLVQCTKKAVFDSHLASLCPLGSGALIVSSVLENFIADVCHGLEVSEAGLFANQQITAHVEALAAAVRDTPDSHAFISPLLDRRIPNWFSEKLPDLNSWLTQEVQRHALPNLAVISRFDVTPELLETDGIHLVPAAGDSFLSHLSQSITATLPSLADVTLVEEFTTVGSSESEDDDPIPVDGEDKLEAILKIVKNNAKKLSRVRPLKAAISKLAETTSAFEAQVRLRRQRDNHVFARIKEEADSDQNRARENRVAISGLERASSGLSTHQAKKDYYSQIVMDLISKACPSLDPAPSIVDVIVNIHRQQASPSVEVILDTVSGAHAFRKAASSLAKDNDPVFAKLFFSNSVTQATRVRIEIMKAIAKKLTTTTENAYVQGFISRPVMRYVVREQAASFAAGTGRSYSFVDCVTRFGDLVLSQDLTTAYKRAGSTFRGAMEQYFVVLAEVGDSPIPSGSNQAPMGVRGRRGAPLGSRGWVRGGRGRKRFGSPPQASSSKKPST